VRYTARERHDATIPSVNTMRIAKGTTPPPANIIPFTKPRAISELAAANPKAIVIVPASNHAPADDNAATRLKIPTLPPTAAPSAQTTIMNAAPVHAAPAVPVATRVATGWTPPQSVKPLAQAAIAPALPVTPSAIAPTPTATPLQQASPAPRPAAQMTAVAPSDEAAATTKWGVYDQLGLGAPKQSIASSQAAKLIVSGYRLLGFTILTIIVVVLIGYIFQTAFFYMSNSWVVPMAVSPSDERVVVLQAQLAEQQNNRDRIADELNQAERAIAAQQQFQVEFGKAIKSDLEGRKLALGRIRALADAAAATRASIRNQSSAYASESRRRMAEQYAAGLIDRNTMLSGKFQIAQITSSNLTLAERQAEFETRAHELEAQTRSLDALIETPETPAEIDMSQDVALSYEVLRIKQEYESSKLDLAKSIEARDTLEVSLERQDKILDALKASAYLRAVNDGASVAFVPYGNLPEVEKGASLYACKLGMVFCYHVGQVLEVLPGEVQFKHPHRDKTLRGQLLELKLESEDADAAADDVLFVGGKPLFL
jgi:hypothetical protein